MQFNKRRNKHNLFDNGNLIDSDEENEKIDNEINPYHNGINFVDKNRKEEIEKAVLKNFPFNISQDEISSPETNETNNRIIFSSQIMRRGRKPKKLISNKRYHEGSDFDNILRKIQVHFLNFIISFLDDIVHTFLHNKKKFFQKLDYASKRIVNFNYIQILKGYTIKELIANINPSPKYKTSTNNNENINQLYVEKLDKYDSFNNFIRFSFSEAFKIYYNQKKPLKSIVLGGKEILLSKDTKSFSYLLKKNIKYEKELIQVTEKVYLTEFDFSYNSFDFNLDRLNSFNIRGKKNPFKTILYD